MEIPNLSVNNGNPNWGLHEFSDGAVWHCCKNPLNFWTAIGPARESTKPIKLVLGQVNIRPALHLDEDKLMSGAKKAFPKDKADKKSVKTADKKEKKAVKAVKKSKKS